MRPDDVSRFELAMREGRFSDADNILFAYVPHLRTTEEALTILTLASYGREHLPEWPHFYDRVEADMKRKLGHERTARLLATRPKEAAPAVTGGGK